MSNDETVRKHGSRYWAWPLVFAAALSLTGCLDDNETDSSVTQRIGAKPQPANSAPTISGQPSATAKVNEPYTFRPAASDADGDKLTFQIANKPAWASFDSATGRLSGTPSSSASGTFADIRISVSDGKLTTSLAPFSISVASALLGSATLSWQPPTSNTDGSPLTNLAGYVVRYGNAPDDLASQVRIANPGLTSYVIEALTPATWYFQVTAFNSAGVESAPSALASKTIS